MAITVFKKLALTGGGAGALDSIDGAAVLDGDMAFVAVGGILYCYVLDDDLGGAESSPDIITPDANAGTKRWVLQTLPNAVLPTVNVPVTFIIDGGGAAITTGQKGHLVIPFSGTIVGAYALADQSGSIVVDVWKDTYANYPPTDADSITASAPVTITTAVKSYDSTLTGWTVAITAGDILAFNVDSVTTVERVTIVLVVER